MPSHIDVKIAHVICDEHSEHMQPALGIFHHDAYGTDLPEAWVNCQMPGCKRHYNPSRGYFTLNDGQYLAESTLKHICQDDKFNDVKTKKWASMGLIRDADGAITWYCFQCGRREAASAAA